MQLADLEASLMNQEEWQRRRKVWQMPNKCLFILWHLEEVKQEVGEWTGEAVLKVS